MEQFKICEKEMKTKAYSKEGLAREAKLDPKEAEKEERRVWLGDCLDRLGELVETIEADLEKYTSGKGKSKSKEQASSCINISAGAGIHKVNSESYPADEPLHLQCCLIKFST